MKPHCSICKSEWPKAFDRMLGCLKLAHAAQQPCRDVSCTVPAEITQEQFNTTPRAGRLSGRAAGKAPTGCMCGMQAATASTADEVSSAAKAECSYCSTAGGKRKM